MWFKLDSRINTSILDLLFHEPAEAIIEYSELVTLHYSSE